MGQGSKEQRRRACGAEAGRKGDKVKQELGDATGRPTSRKGEGHLRGRQGRTPDPEEGAAGAGGAMTGAAARGRSLRLPRGRTPGRPWGGSGSPPKPHPPSGLGRPLESGCLSPRKGSETLIGFSVLPGTPSPHQGAPPLGRLQSGAGTRPACRTWAAPWAQGPGGAQTAGAGDTLGRSPVTPTSSPSGAGSPAARLPVPEGGGRGTPPGAVSPRLGCRVTEREGGGCSCERRG